MATVRIHDKPHASLSDFSEHWGRLLAFGIILLLLGGFAIWFSIFSTFLTIAALSLLLIAGGLVVLVHAFWIHRWGGFLQNFLLGVLYLVLGVLLFSNPLISAMSLTLLMAAFFVVSGLFRSIAAIVTRFDHWGWFLVSGLVTLLLGILIWAQWPVSALYILGLFVGIDLLFAGWAMVTMAFAAKSPEQLGHA